LNPGKNYSVEVHGDDVVVVDGISCNGDPLHWQFALISTWSGYKKVLGSVAAWLPGSDGPSRIERLEVQRASDMSLPSCANQSEHVAYIWDMSPYSRWMHLRVPPTLSVHVNPMFSIPEGVK
jgi:hypothetical protein